MWWGSVCALAAAALYGVASVLQAMAAKAAAGSTGAGAPRLLLRVIGGWRFLLGIGLDLLGFAFQLAALQVLPLFVVQAALAASLAVTALAARLLLGVRLGRREWCAIVAVCLGLGLLGISAKSEEISSAGPQFSFWLVCAVVLLGVAGLSAGFAPRRLRAPILGLLAGLGFGVVAISGRIIPDLVPLHLITEPATYTAVVGGGVATLLFASALQRGSVTVATAMMVIGETVVPALVGIVALGDQTLPGFAPVAGAGFVLAVVAALALARFGEPTPDDGSAVKHSETGGRSS